MSKSNVSIPAELIPEFEAWGKLTVKVFGELRRREGIVPKGVPEDQVWFWSKEWQEKEQEADEALANEEYISFDNVEEAIKHLHKQA